MERCLQKLCSRHTVHTASVARNWDWGYWQGVGGGGRRAEKRVRLRIRVAMVRCVVNVMQKGGVQKVGHGKGRRRTGDNGERWGGGKGGGDSVLC